MPDKLTFCLYILRSTTSGKIYIGQTNNVNDRLKRHNAGRSLSTKHDRPWRIVYREEFSTRSEAIRREQFLKSPEVWKELQHIKQIFENNGLDVNVAQLAKPSLRDR